MNFTPISSAKDFFFIHLKIIDDVEMNAEILVYNF